MTSIVDKYYRKISENIDNLKIKFDISSLLVKSKEHDNKIENIYNNFLIESEINKKDNNILNNINNNFYSRSYINDNYHLKNNVYDKKFIDDNFLIESDIDKKDNAILNNINNNFYSRSYINDNYLIKGNTYDKDYIDNNFFTKQTLNNSFASYYVRIDAKDNEVLKTIENNYYNKNELNNNFNNLYNRTYLDNKFDNIYNKNEVNDKTSKLDRNIVLLYQNLTNFIDKTYKEDQKLQDDKINENSLTDIQINKINELENIDLGKINSSYNFSVFNKLKLDKMKYYIKEFIPFNITLVKKFTFIGAVKEIMILQFELDQREFDINDSFQFFLNITIQYDVSKNNYYRLKLKFDILYDDETLIKQHIKIPISKGLVYHNLMNFKVNNFFKLSKKTEKIIFKIYMTKINEALQDEIVFTLQNAYENNYCDIIHYKIV